VANALNENLTGRYVILNGRTFKPDYQDIKHRVFLVEEGFGAVSYTSGTAIFGTTPVDGESFRAEGFDVERFATDEEIASVTKPAEPELKTEPSVFHFLVTVETDTVEHAEQVMAERINPDEDYGFEYTVDWGAAP
jgi:hypothetical protein